MKKNTWIVLLLQCHLALWSIPCDAKGEDVSNILNIKLSCNKFASNYYTSINITKGAQIQRKRLAYALVNSPSHSPTLFNGLCKK